MEDASLAPVVEHAAQEKNYETLDYVKELFLHAVEQEKIEKKRLRVARVTMILVACMAAVLVIAALVVVPPVTKALGEAQSVLEKVNALDLATLSADVTALMGEASDSLKTVGDAAAQLETLDVATMNEAISSLTETVVKFSQIDVNTLNDAITKLNETVTPFANFFSKFK